MTQLKRQVIKGLETVSVNKDQLGQPWTSTAHTGTIYPTWHLRSFLSVTSAERGLCSQLCVTLPEVPADEPSLQ